MGQESVLTYNILLSGSRAGDDYVFRFDVPVDNFTVMKMLQSRSDLFDIL